MKNLTDAPPAAAAFSCETRLKEKLHEWFVVYNPYYFASALCFLAGIWLASAESAAIDWRQGDLALLGVMQLYEIALLGAAALLWRRGAVRPATVLLLLEMLFFFDPTGEIASLIHLEPWDVPVAAGWLILAFLKIRWLEKIFELRLSGSTWALLLSCTTLLVVSPLLLDSFPRAAGLLHPILLFLSLALAAFALSGHCRVTTASGHELAGKAASCLQFALVTTAALTLLHTLSWVYLFDLAPGLYHLRAVYLFAILWLLARGRIVLGALALAIVYLPEIVRALNRLDRADLALSLIAAAFALLAAGLGLHLRFAAPRSAAPGDGAPEGS